MRKKILVADDEPQLLELIARRLKTNNYEVVTASDGVEALKKTSAENPDLIILDIKMAQMDGYTALLRLKADEKTRSIPVIILTAYDKMKDLFELEGVSDYIVKPFNDQDFLLRVSRALKR